MNGHDPVQHPSLLDHEGRITRLEEVTSAQQKLQQRFETSHEALVEKIQSMQVAILTQIQASEQALRTEFQSGQKALREEFQAGQKALRDEFNADRRFSWCVITSVLLAMGAILFRALEHL